MADASRASLDLPFYLYEGPDFDDGRWFEPCSKGLRGERVEEDQYSAEHYWLRQLSTHRWRTRDPDAALLFVVPLYLNAALQPSVRGLSCNGTHHQLLLDRTARAVEAGLPYRRHLGADHMLVANTWRAALRAPKMAPWAESQVSTDYFRAVFRNAIVGHMESRHADDTGFWRCSVVSPYVANYDAHAHATPTSARDVSFYFQGAANSRGTFGYAFRQAALAQLDGLRAARISAYSLPGSPAPCRGGRVTNCRAPRARDAFRATMGRARFNLVLRGDSPPSRRLYDGIGAGALTVLVSDEIWRVGLPFQCLIPWRDIAVTVGEAPFLSARGGRAEIEAVSARSTARLDATQRLANAYRRDVLWNVDGSRVAENVLITAAHRCLPAHITRHAAARADAPGRSLRALRALCPHADLAIACREPDRSGCAGCETGHLATSTPIEHCCADSCPECHNHTASCAPRGRRARARCEELEAYLARRDKNLPGALERWRRRAGRPQDPGETDERQSRVRGRTGRPSARARREIRSVAVRARIDHDETTAKELEAIAARAS